MDDARRQSLLAGWEKAVKTVTVVTA